MLCIGEDTKCLINRLSRQDSNLRNDSIKTSCLTTWLRPIILYLLVPLIPSSVGNIMWIVYRSYKTRHHVFDTLLDIILI